MQIISLNLSGFKNYDLNTQLNFRDQNNSAIFEREFEQKDFIFESILGVVYGLSAEEKERFRKAESKVFTGLVTLDFAERTLLIERDFETDFVACLLATPQKIKPFFQGKDIIRSAENRPYLQLLKSLFPITDKNLILEICYNSAPNKAMTLSDLFDTLYLLLSPQIKIAEARNLIQESKLTQENFRIPAIEAPLNEQIDFLKWKRAYLIDLLKVDSKIDEIDHDLEKLQLLINSIQNKDHKLESALSELKSYYPKIFNHNALQFRADVLLWKSLRDNKIQREVKLENTTTRLKKIQRLIHSDFLNYQDIPKTFEDDINRYQNLKTELSLKEERLVLSDEKLMAMEKQLKLRQKKRRFVLFLLPLLIFLLSYIILGSFWLFIIPETLIVIFAILLYFGHLNETIRADIFNLNEERRMTEFGIREIKHQIIQLIESNPLFKDEEHLALHVDRFRKYKDYLNELKEMKKLKTALYDLLNSEPYTKQIAAYEEKYAELININRPDLEQYLDDFVNAQDKFNGVKSGNFTYPGVDEISILKRKYLISYNELKSVKEKVLKKLKLEPKDIDAALNKITRKLKNLEMELESE